MPGKYFRFQYLGPGLLYAGAAIGVSHLVQSTRAGAEYGLWMIVPVVLANVLKWTFFIAGPFYAAVRGESLIAGYRHLGKIPFYTNLAITAATVPGILGAVTLVTAGIVNAAFGFDKDVRFSSAAIIGIGLLLLLKGRYPLMDKIIKWIIILLSISTIVAVGLIWETPSQHFWPDINWLERRHLTFLIALMGWMPAPIDLSIWQSIWSIEKFKIHSQARNIFKLDFNVGYVITTLLAVVFLILGFFSLYGKGATLPSDATGFAAAILSMYEKAFGRSFSWIIKIAAITCMFSTVITVLDAYPRVISESIVLAGGKGDKRRWNELLLWIVAICGLLMIFFFKSNMKGLVTLATVISFVTAPLLAWFNTLLLQKTGFFSDDYFSIKKILTALGLIYLLAFTTIYLFSLVR